MGCTKIGTIHKAQLPPGEIGWEIQAAGRYHSCVAISEAATVARRDETHGHAVCRAEVGGLHKTELQPSQIGTEVQVASCCHSSVAVLKAPAATRGCAGTVENIFTTMSQILKLLLHLRNEGHVCNEGHVRHGDVAHRRIGAGPVLAQASVRRGKDPEPEPNPAKAPWPWDSEDHDVDDVT